MNDPPMQATPDEIVTEQMIDAGLTAVPRLRIGAKQVAAIYLAMHKARTLEVSPPTDLVERLLDPDADSLMMHEACLDAAAELTRLSADNAGLRGRIDNAMRVIEGGYSATPHPTNKGQCVHERFDHEDCIACYDDALCAALGKG